MCVLTILALIYLLSFTLSSHSNDSLIVIMSIYHACTVSSPECSTRHALLPLFLSRPSTQHHTSHFPQDTTFYTLMLMKFSCKCKETTLCRHWLLETTPYSTVYSVLGPWSHINKCVLIFTYNTIFFNNEGKQLQKYSVSMDLLKWSAAFCINLCLLYVAKHAKKIEHATSTWE